MTAFAWLAPITAQGRLAFWGLSALWRWRLTQETARSAALGVLAEIEVLALSLSNFAKPDRDLNSREPAIAGPMPWKLRAHRQS
jgi:hypothetical protein